MKERREYSQYDWIQRSTDGLKDATEQLNIFRREMTSTQLRGGYEVDFFIGDTNYFIYTEYLTELPELIFLALNLEEIRFKTACRLSLSRN